MIALTISAKELSPMVKYNKPFQRINLRTKEEDKALFIAEILKKEVIHDTKNKKKQKKKLKIMKSLYKKFGLMLVGSVLITPKFALANTGNPLMVNNSPITPQIVMDWGITLALITVAIGVALSGSLLALAGVFRMLRKRREAEEWSVDIIKGLVQVLIAIPTVYSLYYLAQIVFQSLPVLGELF